MPDQDCDTPNRDRNDPHQDCHTPDPDYDDSDQGHVDPGWNRDNLGQDSDCPVRGWRSVRRALKFGHFARQKLKRNGG